MNARSDLIDEALTARLLDRGLPPWAAPVPAPPGDPIALVIADIHRITGHLRWPCSARDMAIALDCLSSTLASVPGA